MPLPDEDKQRFIEDLKRMHFDDVHLKCFNCTEPLKRHEIADGVPDEGTLKAICGKCAKDIYGEN
jgi:uncharacterized CHY-type Zn-finger protein